jgi:ribosomal protein L13E
MAHADRLADLSAAAAPLTGGFVVRKDGRPASMEDIPIVADARSERGDPLTAINKDGQGLEEAIQAVARKLLLEQQKTFMAQVEAKLDETEHRVNTKLRASESQVDAKVVLAKMHECMAQLEQRVETSLRERVETLLQERVGKLEAENSQLVKQLAAQEERLESQRTEAEALANVLMKANGKMLGFAVAHVKAAGLTCEEARKAGYSCAEAKQAGYPPRACYKAGYTYEEAKACGYRYDRHAWVQAQRAHDWS